MLSEREFVNRFAIARWSSGESLSDNRLAVSEFVGRSAMCLFGSCFVSVKEQSADSDCGRTSTQQS